MPASKPPPPKTQRRFGTIWGELDYVCKRIHYWLYRRGSSASARRYLNRLERILRELPENDLAIVREEALAQLYELKGEVREAIEHRQREIELTERLHRSVQKSIERGEYDERMGDSILAGRDHAILRDRRAILRTLQEQSANRRSLLMKRATA